MSEPKVHHAHAHAHAHGSIKTYLWVFFALIVGTILTVAAWKVHIPSILVTILVALVIASVKASLVAGWFMHLATEQRMIYAILAFTAFFFLGMMFLTVWAVHDAPKLVLP